MISNLFCFKTRASTLCYYEFSEDNQRSRSNVSLEVSPIAFLSPAFSSQPYNSIKLPAVQQVTQVH